MKKRRSRSATPIALLWTARDQTRFIDAVEKFVGAVGDMTFLMGELTRIAATIEAKASRRRRTPATQEQNTDNGVSL